MAAKVGYQQLGADALEVESGLLPAVSEQTAAPGFFTRNKKTLLAVSGVCVAALAVLGVIATTTDTYIADQYDAINLFPAAEKVCQCPPDTNPYRPGGPICIIGPAYAKCTKIVGDLRLDGSKFTKAEYTNKNIKEITGSLRLDGHNGNVKAVKLPALKKVGGEVIVWTQKKLKILALQNLVSIGEDFTIKGQNQYLFKVLLYKLKTVGKDIKIMGMNGKGDLAFPALTDVGASPLPNYQKSSTMIGVKSCKQMTKVTFPALTNFEGQLMIDGSGGAGLKKLTLIGLPKLKTVGTIGAYYVAGPLKIHAPALEGAGNIKVKACEEGLKDWLLPKVKQIGNFEYENSGATVGKILMPNLETIGADISIAVGLKPNAIVRMDKLTTVNGEFSAQLTGGAGGKLLIPKLPKAGGVYTTWGRTAEYGGVKITYAEGEVDMRSFAQQDYGSTISAKKVIEGCTSPKLEGANIVTVDKECA